MPACLQDLHPLTATLLGLILGLAVGVALGWGRSLQDPLAPAPDGGSRRTPGPGNAEPGGRRETSLGLQVGGLAHDLNNLVGALLGNLQLAQGGLPDEGPHRIHLGRAEQCADRAADLCRRLMACAGRGTTGPRPMELNATLVELADLMRVRNPEGVQVALHLDPQAQWISFEPAGLQQVILNLLANATEAQEGRAGRVSVKTSPCRLETEDLAEGFVLPALHPGAHVLLAVSDEGCGMAPEVLARLFEPHFTTKGPGRGLGLSALPGLLSAHGAGLRVSSRPGVGSRFEVYFPCHPETKNL